MSFNLTDLGVKMCENNDFKNRGNDLYLFNKTKVAGYEMICPKDLNKAKL